MAFRPSFTRSCGMYLARILILSFFIPFTTSQADPPPDAETWFEQSLEAALASEDAAAEAEQHHQALLEKAHDRGRIPVIVRLRMDPTPEAALDAPSVQAQREQLASIQDQVLDRLSSAAFRDEAEMGLKRFTLTPAFAIWVDALDLQELLDDPDVLEIVEDSLSPPALAQSVPLIGADGSGTFSGRTGQGQVVAIIDTGVDKNHSFLSGKVASEACYSTNVPAQGVTSLCPGGATASTASNSGLDCSTNIAGCGHGTHVAGIAAGKGGSFSGVAKDARIIAIKVFSQITGSDCTDFGLTSPCALTFGSDQIQALERVYALRNAFNIAAANMSLGGGRNTSTCDGDSRKTAIDNLRSVGIATTVSSGNNSYTNAVGSPACISTTISVGSTTKQDVVSSFSNSVGFLDLLAPGSSIQSSVPGNNFAFFNGTSMAAPHVAGAWAVLKQAKPGAGVSEIENVLKTTGKAVTDNRNGITKPRIQVDAALTALIGGGVPGKPTTISPSGNITTNQPTYTWNAVSGATWYQLYVNDSTGNRIATWYTASQTNCPSGSGTCSIRPAVNLANGNAMWWVRGWNNAGEGPWSDGRAFNVNAGANFSAEITSLWPVSNARAGQTSTLWALVRNSGSNTLPGDALVWYYVRGPGIDTYVGSRSVSGLSPGTSSWYAFNWAIAASANPGTYTYWARVYRGGTPLSDWSSPQNFTVSGSGGPPGKPTTISPSGTITTNQPTYTWNAVSGATWYQLYVNDSTGNRIATWYTASQTNCPSGSGTCSIKPAVNLAAGSATWWVQGWNNFGTGPWSDARSFTVSGTVGGFNEQFKGGNASNWTRHSGSWGVVSNEYYFTQGAADRWSTSTYNAQYGDLDYSARIWRDSSQDFDANRILIRAGGTVGSDGNLANYYSFQITRDGDYSVYRRVNGVSLALQNWTSSSSIHQGSAWNTLRVIAKGSNMAFYINGSKVWQGSDGSLSSGRVGVGMFRSANTTGNGFWVDWATLNPNPQAILGSPTEADGTPDEASEGAATERTEEGSPAGSTD